MPPIIRGGSPHTIIYCTSFFECSSTTKIMATPTFSVQEHTDDAAVLLQRGNFHARQDEFHEAAAAYNKASLLPNGKEIWRWKPLGFCPTIFSDEKSIEQYWTRLNRSLDLFIDTSFLLDWRTLPYDGFFPSFNLPHLGKNCREVRERFARVFKQAFREFVPPKPRKNPDRLRIGFHVMRGHEGGFVRGSAGIINALNRKRYEIFVFAPEAGMRLCRQAIHHPNVHFVALRGSFESMVRQVRTTECDSIYYRKAGSDPWSYFFPFTRCARVQVTSYGTHGTSGNEAIDFFLSSRFVEPENTQQYYTERLFLLDSVPTFQFPHKLPDVPASHAEFSLPEGKAIYFCPHRIGKYHPSFDVFLNEIGQRDTEGIFVLLIGRNSRSRDPLLKRLQDRLTPAVFQRLHFFSALPLEQYKRLFSLATVLLDSPVYAGGLTSFDAFSFNVPEVTLSGPLHTQNFATGIYRCMGLEDLPCRTPGEYIDLAVRLGTDAHYRNEISGKIEANRHKIFAAGDIVQEHERFFESVCLQDISYNGSAMH